MRRSLICSIHDINNDTQEATSDARIDELSEQIEEAIAAGNHGEAEELYLELEQLTA